ncbi:MAG: GntR family transcriptional regulator [Clostridia bacterium]|nr:GntR family transcriptional regulator [Clostridia bacterium]
MDLIINNSSMVPIYEQIVEQIKTAIVSGKLTPQTMLPSVRSFAKDLKISALTVKKAYDLLEEEGFTVTVHGKGTFVAETNSEKIKEEQLKEIEEDFSRILLKGKRYGLSNEELKELFEIQFLED